MFVEPYRRTAILSTIVVALTACNLPQPQSEHVEAKAAAGQQATEDDLALVYERSIRSAAVRDPGFSVELKPIPRWQPLVTVAHFTEWGIPASPTNRPLWVTLPDELRALCRDKPNAVLALEQILGLPPRAKPRGSAEQWLVLTFMVPRSALFRPCPGGTDIAEPKCSSDLGSTSAGRSPPSVRDAATTAFLLDQIWSSNRIGFQAANGQLDWGYPFTGMGWTYNWDPQATSPVGVAEFVVQKATRIFRLTAMSPAQFCTG